MTRLRSDIKSLDEQIEENKKISLMSIQEISKYRPKMMKNKEKEIE